MALFFVTMVPIQSIEYAPITVDWWQIAPIQKFTHSITYTNPAIFTQAEQVILFSNITSCAIYVPVRRILLLAITVYASEPAVMATYSRNILLSHIRTPLDGFSLFIYPTNSGGEPTEQYPSNRLLLPIIVPLNIWENGPIKLFSHISTLSSMIVVGWI